MAPPRGFDRNSSRRHLRRDRRSDLQQRGPHQFHWCDKATLDLLQQGNSPIHAK